MKIPLHDYWQLLWRYLRPQFGTVLLMTVLLLASIALQLVGPQVARSFIDAARAGANTRMLLRSALVFIIVAAVQKTMSVLATYWSERVAWIATNDLRVDLVAHIVRLDLGFHKARTPGELIERVDGDVSALAGFFSSFVVKLFGSVLLLGGVLVATYLVDERLGLAFAAYFAISLISLSLIRRLAIPHWIEDREHSAAFYGYLSEAFAATEDIRSNGAVRYAVQRLLEYLRSWAPIRLRAGVWESGVWLAALAIFAIGEAIAYGLGGGLYRAGVVSLGVVYMVVAYTAMLAEPIEAIRTQLQELQRADASIARVRELMETTPKLKDGTKTVPPGALSVEVCRISFGYEDKQHRISDDQREAREVVIKDLSFELEAGRVLGLLGRTGSGKTTIARLLFRLYDPQQGEIYLGGVDSHQAKLKALRTRVGFVTQQVQLLEASLRDNITFFDPDISDKSLYTVLEALGLGPWLERLPHGLNTIISGSDLSAGEAQLVALARVFLKDPGLVILDEAASRLDPVTEALLEQALDRLIEGRTALIIAHRLATIERADDILILEDGHILEHGPREELAADPNSRFAKLCRSGIGEMLT